MSRALRIHCHSSSSSYSSTHNNNNNNNNSNNNYFYYIQSSSFPSSSSSLTSTSASSPISISISFRALLPSPLTAFPQQHQELGDSPLSIELIPISSDDHFDQLLAHSQHPLIILWMAKWCRKCIYLKPKLEKLAAEYYPRLRFYTVDVNTVSHKLVARAGVTKMPTIQLWKDGKKQAEVIGGHNAYWVIGDVEEMIENECTM